MRALGCLSMMTLFYISFCHIINRVQGPMIERPNRLDFPLPSKGEIDKAGTHRAVVYVPSTTDQNTPISKKMFDSRVARVSREVSRIFGGDTVQRASFGNWIDDNGVLVKENVARIEFFTTPKNYRKNDATIGNMIQRLAKEWGQWAISYEYQAPNRARALYFVHPVQDRRRLNKVI
jgi:hypothetical protein